MNAGNNPYQPPAALEEDVDAGAQSTDSATPHAMAVAASLVFTFAVSVGIFHSLATQGMGAVRLSLALLFFCAFSGFVIAKLIQLFRKF